MPKIFKIKDSLNLEAKLYKLIARKSPLLKDLYKEVVEEVCSRVSSGRILDIGTGPGYLPLELAKSSRGLEIIGIDISTAMVKIANKNAENMELSDRVKFQIGDAMNLPFGDDYFDFVVSTLSLHRWLKPIECLKEIHRVLKENGKALIYDVRRDTTKEENTQFKEKYNRFLSFLFLKRIKAHPSITTLKKIGEILSSPEIDFSNKSMEDKGVFFKLRLSK